MNSIKVLYEDERLFAVLKPAGLAVQGGEGVSNSLDTVLPKQLGCKIHLIHRLDKETEGIVLAAKNAESASYYMTLLNTNAVKKEYVAICFGVLQQKSGVITEPVTVKGVQKQAVTQFNLINTYTDFSHVSLILGSGRMHQIRIHLAQMGFPIVADDKHGNFVKNKEAKKLYGVKRLQLAAVSVTFPTQNGIQNINIDLPDHMRNLLNMIKV